MKSLFAKTDNSIFFKFPKIMFFLLRYVFIVLVSCIFLGIFYLIKITQLQFDWD